MKKSHFLVLSIAILLGASAAIPWLSGDSGTSSGPDEKREPLKILADGHAVEMSALIQALEKKRVVFIGESHDRYDHHLNQLDIIRDLHELRPQWALGLELFPQPFQPYLDAYIIGELNEREFLEKTGYLQRWKLDYRLYRPILDYAKEHGIPLVALNIPRKIVHRVALSGIAGLSPEERVWVPDGMDRSDNAYRERLRTVFEEHPGRSDFEHFVEAQLLWDEAMAARIADYLKHHPERSMVVIAGGGHLAYGAGIPRRLQRRMPVDMAIVLQTRTKSIETRGADYLLISDRIELPPSGRLGVIVKPEVSTNQGVALVRFTLRSPAREAGLRPGDRIVAIDGRPIRDLIGLRLVLQDKQPGAQVTVRVARNAEPESSVERSYNVTLREP